MSPRDLWEMLCLQVFVKRRVLWKWRTGGELSRLSQHSGSKNHSGRGGSSGGSGNNISAWGSRNLPGGVATFTGREVGG